jgi:hypothetical protein
MRAKTNFMPYLMLTILLLGFLAGCAGTKPLSPSVRAGDTIVLGAGWKQSFNRSSLTVRITGSDSSVTTYQPGNPAVRAVINLYPDPLSYIVVGTRSSQGVAYQNGATYGSLVNGLFTGNDPDWWQTSIYLDLPSTLPIGTAKVRFDSVNGETYGPIPVTIIPGLGSPSGFNAETLGAMSPEQLQSMERSPSYTVNFTGGSTIPASIQIDLTHNPDNTAGGAGKAFVVNPRGEMKNISWTDNGTSMRVMLLSSGDGTTKDPYFPGSYQWNYYKFYVTGGITGLAVTSVKAYDVNGALISGVTASVQ